MPDEPGVYRFRDAQRRVCYLGRASNLRSRVGSYWGELADRPHLRRMVPQVTSVEALVCASVHEAGWLERNLLERSLPRWNRVRGGAEIPAWLVLDTSAEHPELRVSVDPVSGLSCFGPYLGFEQARLLRSALLRVWPLNLAGRRPDAATGSLAEARGVGPADHDYFAASIASLLGRDAALLKAHRAAMIEARDRAQNVLAFETAQQIQFELAAVAALTAPQRVTGCQPPDLVVHGWADGALISLSATAGRLDRWGIKTVTEPTGRRFTAATPPEWREFARINAELAARLRG